MFYKIFTLYQRAVNPKRFKIQKHEGYIFAKTPPNT